MSTKDSIEELTVLRDNLEREIKEDNITFDLIHLDSTPAIFERFRKLKYEREDVKFENLDSSVIELVSRFIEGSSLPLSQLCSGFLQYVHSEIDNEQNKDVEMDGTHPENSESPEEYYYSHLSESKISEIIKGIAVRKNYGEDAGSIENPDEDQSESCQWYWECHQDNLKNEKKKLVLAARKIRAKRSFERQKLLKYMQEVEKGSKEEKVRKAQELYIKSKQGKMSAVQNYNDMMNKMKEMEKKKEEKKAKQQQLLREKKEAEEKKKEIQQQHIKNKKEEEEKKKEHEKEGKQMRSLFSFFSPTTKRSVSMTNSTQPKEHSRKEEVNSTFKVHSSEQTPSSSLSGMNCSLEGRYGIVEEWNKKKEQYKRDCNDSMDIPQLLMKSCQLLNRLKQDSQAKRTALAKEWKSEYKRYLQANKPTVIEIPSESNPANENALQNKNIVHLKQKHFYYENDLIYPHLYSYYSYQLRQFYEDNRPSFFGYTKKISLHVSGRHPFRQIPDRDYETDSGVEWYDDLENSGSEEEEEEEEEGNQPNQFDFHDNFLVEDEIEGDDMSKMTSEEKSKYILNQLAGRRKGEEFSSKTRVPILLNRMNPSVVELIKNAPSVVLNEDSTMEESFNEEKTVEPPSLAPISTVSLYRYIPEEAPSAPTEFPSTSLTNVADLAFYSCFPLCTREFILHQQLSSAKMTNNQENAVPINGSPSKSAGTKSVSSPSKRIEMTEEMLRYLVLVTHNQSLSMSAVVETVFTKYPLLKKIQIQTKFKEIIDHKQKTEFSKKPVNKVKSTVLQQLLIPENYVYDVSSNSIPVFDEHGNVIREIVEEKSNHEEEQESKEENEAQDTESEEFKRVKDAILSTTSFTNGFNFCVDSNSGFEEIPMKTEPKEPPHQEKSSPIVHPKKEEEKVVFVSEESNKRIVSNEETNTKQSKVEKRENGVNSPKKSNLFQYFAS